MRRGVGGEEALRFQREVWAGDVILRMTRVSAVDAVRVDEVSQGE